MRRGRAGRREIFVAAGSGKKAASAGGLVVWSLFRRIVDEHHFEMSLLSRGFYAVVNALSTLLGGVDIEGGLLETDFTTVAFPHKGWLLQKWR